jgi:hypothetical protein
LKAWKKKRDKEIEEEELAKAKRAESAVKRGKTKTPRASEKAGKSTSQEEKPSKDGKGKQAAGTVPAEKPPVRIPCSCLSRQTHLFLRKHNHRKNQMSQ